MVTLGYLLSALAKPVLGVAFGWPMVLGARVLDRVGKGLRSAPRDAMIADAASATTRGRAFGFHSAADTAAARRAAVRAGPDCLARRGEPAPYFRARAAARPRCRGDDGAHSRPRPRRGKARRGTPARLIWTRPLVGFFAISVLLGSSIVRCVPDPARQRPGAEHHTGHRRLHRLQRRLHAPGHARRRLVGPRRPQTSLRARPAIFAAVYAGFALAGGSTWVWPLFAIYGAYIALTDGVGKALLTDLAPKDSRGTVLGMYQFALGLTALVASVLAGALWDTLGAPAPFWLGAGGALAAALLLLVLPLRHAVPVAAP